MPDAIFVHEGDAIDYTPVAAVDAGAVVVVKRIVGVTRQPIAAGALGSLAVEGVFDMPKEDDAEIDTGEWCYWDTGNEYVTTTDTGDLPCGFCTADAAAADERVRVYLQYAPATA